MDALRTHKLRSALTIFGVVLGVSVIMLVAALITGFDQQVQENVKQFGADTAFVTKWDQGRHGGPPPLEEIQRKPLTTDDQRALLESCPAIKNVTAFIESDWDVAHSVRTKSGEVTGIDFRGVQSNFGIVYANAATLAGRFISEGDDDIYDNTIAGIFASTVSSANGVTISAANNETIWSLAIGVAGSLASAGAGVAVGGAGSGSGNQVTDTTEALIANSGTDPLAGQEVTGTTSVTTTSGDVDLSATETVSIIAGAGTGAFTVGLGDTAAVAPSIGVSAAVNTITDTVEANIDDSTVTAAGGVSLTASTQPPAGADSIKAVTVAGGLAVGVGEFGSAFPFAGAGSGNTITDRVTASITDGSTVTATSGNVTLSATDSSTIEADGGGVTVGFAAGTTSVTAGAGAGVAKNWITNTTKAYIDSSTVTAEGAVP